MPVKTPTLTGTRVPEPAERLWSASFAKRGFDLMVASTGLVVLLPLLGVISLGVKLTSRGPVFFRQRRIGKGQVPFTIYKYRTMHLHSERQGPSVTRSTDTRMTKFGLLLRRYKLDELPQLLNVIRGEMSLVGPRPKLERHERMRMTCRPGLTGAATLVFKHEQVLLTQVPEEAVEEFAVEILNVIKARLDGEYARTSTFRSDVKMLLATLVRSKGVKPVTTIAEVVELYGSDLAP